MMLYSRAVSVTAKGTGPQDRTGPQGWSRRGRDSTHRRPCGTLGHPPNPATLSDRSAQGSKSWHSGLFGKYSDFNCHNLLPGVLRVAQGHRITSYGSWHAWYEKKKTGLPTGMSHRTACGCSQVRIDSGPVALYLLQWPPLCDTSTLKRKILQCCLGYHAICIIWF